MMSALVFFAKHEKKQRKNSIVNKKIKDRSRLPKAKIFRIEIISIALERDFCLITGRCKKKKVQNVIMSVNEKTIFIIKSESALMLKRWSVKKAITCPRKSESSVIIIPIKIKKNNCVKSALM